MPIAGFGTRFSLGAKSSLKLMLHFYYKPIIQYTIEKVAASGIADVLIIRFISLVRMLSDDLKQGFESVIINQ